MLKEALLSIAEHEIYPAGIATDALAKLRSKMGARNLLHKSKLNAFLEWATLHGASIGARRTSFKKYEFASREAPHIIYDKLHQKSTIRFDEQNSATVLEVPCIYTRQTEEK